MTYDERARLQSLQDLQVLDTDEEERFDRVVRLAQGLFDVPMVAVSLIDTDRQWFKSRVGLDVRETPRSAAFCDHTIRKAGPMVVTDATDDDRFRQNPLVTGDPNIRFYAGHPIQSPGGHPVGTLCLIDTEPRHMTAEQLDLLEDLAGWVEQELALDEELLRAREVQSALMPRRTADVAGYDIAGLCVPARDLGGDFFDWYFLDGGFQVVLADVMGKGIPAAIIAASVRAVVRGASQFNDLETAVNKAAQALEMDLTDTDTFVTLFAGRLEPESGELTYADAGHGLTAVIGPQGQARWLDSEGLPLGVLSGDKWVADRMVLEPGDTLVSVSDGLLDLFESREAGLAAAIEVTVEASTAQEIVERVSEFAAGRSTHDDATIVVLRRAAA